MTIAEYQDVGRVRIPETQKILHLYGAGMENLKLEEGPVEQPGDDQLLVRIDAVGVCASDYKLIVQGEAHSRVKGRNLAAEPTSPGHEVSMTVVKTGRTLENTYRPGDRYTVQAAIMYQGKSTAFGYWIPGAQRQWHIIGPEVIEGGYLLKIDPKLGYAQAAIAEPWACVFHAYKNHRATQSVKSGGTVWYLGAGPLGLMHVEKGIRDGAKRVIVSEMLQERLDHLQRILGPVAKAHGVELLTVNTGEVRIDSVLPPGAADDIVILCPVPKAAEAALPYLAFGGFMNIFAGFPNRDKAFIQLNLNDMHYNDWTLIATSGSPIEALRRALDDAAAGRIDPNNAVACVGGLGAAIEAMQAVHDGTYPGRIIIYPQIEELPLTPICELTHEGRWSNDAEVKLLEERLP